MTIIIKKASGGVAVTRLIGDADAATCIEQWKVANPGEYVTHAEVAEESLPLDRASRAKWALVNGAVVIDEALTPVPQEVTMRQARLALFNAGLLPSVETAISAMVDPAKTAARIEWDYSQTVRRDKGLVLSLGAALGLNPAAIDALFVKAAGL